MGRSGAIATTAAAAAVRPRNVRRFIASTECCSPEPVPALLRPLDAPKLRDFGQGQYYFENGGQ